MAAAKKKTKGKKGGYARRRASPRRRARKKISIAQTAGLIMTGKRIYDVYKSAPEDLRTPALMMALTGIVDQKYASRLGHKDEKFAAGEVLETWGPLVAGHLIHKYVGGKDRDGNGLGINRSLNIPMFQI